MGLLPRLLNRRAADRDVRAWREAWTLAAANPDEEAVRELRARLDRLAPVDGDLEIEREMVDGLQHVVAFAASVGEHGLPIVPTGHRVVGTDVCHFTAPASMPDDPAQPSGRLLLTSARAIFAGGARAVTVAWHALAEPAVSDRDVMLVRLDGTALYRFRCNSFDDALCAGFVARRLARPRRAGGPV